MADLSEIYQNGIKLLKEKNLLALSEDGAGEKATIRGNELAFKNIYLKMKNLHEQLDVDISRTILGRKVNAPFFPAPLGGIGDVHPDADEYIVKGASEAGCAIFLSDYIQKGIDELAKCSATPIFWVLPTLSLENIESFFKQGEQAGVAALGINIDIAYGIKSGYKHISFESEGIIPPSKGYFEKIRDFTELPLFLKGVLHPDDAKKAVDLGYEAIIISNHGGKVLDYAAPTLYLLPEIKGVVGDDIDVLIDGGFRTATDIYKALALGADGVLLGRAILYAVAANGMDGVRDVLNYLSWDLKRIMAMNSAKNCQEIKKNGLVVITDKRL